MTRPQVLGSVHTETLPVPLRTMCRQRAAAAQLMKPHALQRHAVACQHLLDAQTLPELPEIHPATHAASLSLARIWNGCPLLSTAIR